eukprot:6111247-Pyramimonas_sp.AAC.2
MMRKGWSPLPVAPRASASATGLAVLPNSSIPSGIWLAVRTMMAGAPAAAASARTRSSMTGPRLDGA